MVARFVSTSRNLLTMQLRQTNAAPQASKTGLAASRDANGTSEEGEDAGTAEEGEREPDHSSPALALVRAAP